MARIFEFEKHLQNYIFKICVKHNGSTRSAISILAGEKNGNQSSSSFEQVAARQILTDYLVAHEHLPGGEIHNDLRVDRIIEWAYSHRIFRSGEIKWI